VPASLRPEPRTQGCSLIRIYVDADGCPVKSEVFRVALRYSLKVYVASNSRMRIPPGRLFELVLVGEDAHAADDWIVEHVKEDDIVVSADILFAARCLEKGARVLDPKGLVFTEESIGDALANREFTAYLRDMGNITEGRPRLKSVIVLVSCSSSTISSRPLFERSGRGVIMPRPSGPGHRLLPRGIVIMYEDRDILVVDKPSGLLTMGTDKEKSRTAYFILTDYVRKGQAKSRNRVFIVHRLDRDTSGILVFAKNPEAKHFVQSHWDETTKKYLAVVHGSCEKTSETISTYLAENKARAVYSTSDTTKGRLAHTAYKVLKQSEDYAMLEVDLLTGRKHQARVHLAGIRHPVVGDDRYGKVKGAHKCLALHATSISFTHPFSGKQVTFETTVPLYFSHLVGSLEQEEALKENVS